MTVFVGGGPINIESIVAVARHFETVRLHPRARHRVSLCRTVVDSLLEKNVKVYGLTTGFGALRDKVIPAEHASQLSMNLIRSHAAGVGEPFPEDVVRAAMLLRAQTLAQGCSGVTPHVIDLLIAFLNARIYPYVPHQGSVGSSGDLAPLSHLFLAVTGDDSARIYQDDSFDASSREAFWSQMPRSCSEDHPYIARPSANSFRRLTDIVVKNAVLSRLRQVSREIQWPYELQGKEGLAANNGAVFSTALLALSTYDAERLIHTAERVAAYSFEALQAVPDCLDPALVQLRPHSGYIESAAAIRNALSGSQLVPAHGALGVNLARLNRVAGELHDLHTADGPDYEASAHTEGAVDTAKAKIETVTNEALAALTDSTHETISAIWDNVARERKANEGSVGTPKERELNACRAATEGLRQRWDQVLHKMEVDRGVTQADGKIIVESDDRIATQHQVLQKLRTIYHEHVTKIVPSSPDVQDNYSFRAAATVIGCARDACHGARRVVEIEVNSATDNPLIILDQILARLPSWDGTWDSPTVQEAEQWLKANWALAADCVKSGANFHGQPVGVAADTLAATVAEVGNIAERRVAALTDSNHSKGLPDFLVWKPGLNSGFMIAQYSAAALVSENRHLAQPASTDSVPTCANTEDHVAMSTIAARKTTNVVENVERIVAIEALCAHQAVQFRKPARLGSGTGALETAIAARIKNLVPGTVDKSSAVLGRRIEGRTSFLNRIGVAPAARDQICSCVLDDQELHELIEAVAHLVRTGALAGEVDGWAATPVGRRYSVDPTILATYLQAEWGHAGGEVSTFYKRAADIVFKACSSARVNPTSVLEVGGGLGRFCYEWLISQRNTTSYVWTEPSPQFADWARYYFGGPMPSHANAVKGFSEDPARTKLQPKPEIHVSTLELLKDVDACDMVVALNIVDRHRAPRRFLSDLAHYCAPGGLLVVASPLDWQETYTPPTEWFSDLVPEIRSLGFEIISSEDLDFPFRYGPRKQTVFVSQVVVARDTRSAELVPNPVSPDTENSTPSSG